LVDKIENRRLSLEFQKQNPGAFSRVDATYFAYLSAMEALFFRAFIETRFVPIILRVVAQLGLLRSIGT
jgi:hypothetical protein